MIEKGDVCIWSPDEIVYSVSDKAIQAYPVIQASVRIFTADNLLLNRVELDELHGEPSLILDENRLFNVIAGPANLPARDVRKTYTNKMLNANTLPGAFLRNIQLWLMDSNDQSMELANKLEKLAG